METSIHFQEKIGAINKSKCNCLIPVTLIFLFYRRSKVQNIDYFTKAFSL